MPDSSASLAGSVTVGVDATLAPLQAKLAQAEALLNAFDAKMAAAMSGSSAGSAMASVNATAAQTGATLAAVTAPAAQASAAIEAVGAASVAAAAGLGASTVSASAMAKALEMTGGNLAKVTPEMLGLVAANDAAAVSTVALTEANAGAIATTEALGAAQAETAGLGAGVTREFMVLGSEVARGNFSRIPGSLIVLNERLLSTGTSVLTMKNAMAALGALGSVVFNPYIIGFLAITVGIEVAVKGFEALTKSGEKATDVLKDHDTWLKTILQGYDNVQKAADSYEKTANMLPQGAVSSDLTKKAADDLNAYKAALLSIKSVQTDFLTGYIQANDAFKDVGPATAQAQALSELQKQFSLTNPDLSGLITRLTEVKNSDADAMVRQVAEQMLNAATNAQTLNVALGTTVSALHQMSAFNFNGLQGVGDLVSKLHALTPETRTPKQQASDAFTLGIGQARTTSEVTAAVNAYNATIKAIDTKKLDQLGAKGASAFDTTTASIEKQIAALNTEASSYGLSTAQVEAAKIQQQLLTAAQQDHLALTPKLTAAIMAQAAAYGAAAQAAKIAAANDNINFSRSMLGLNSSEQGIAQQMKDIFKGDWANQMNSTIANQLRLNAALADFKQNLEDVSNTGLSTFLSDLKQGQSFAASFADGLLSALDQVAQKLTQMAIDNLWSNAFGGATGGGGGFNILSLFGLGGSGGGGATAGLGVGDNGVIGGFASGTANTGGTRGVPAGVVHGQEAVIPLPSGGRIPVQVIGGAANSNGGVMRVELAWSQDSDGNIAPIIKSVSQQTTAAGIASYDATMPEKVHHKAVNAARGSAAPINRWAS